MTQSVWDIAIQQNHAKCEIIEEKSEPTIVFIGSANGGKTTIINRFLDRDEKPKPTLALDYTFGRKSTGAFPAKSVVHIWELGGGVKLADLFSVTITPDTLNNLYIVLVLDLSKPEELWITMETLLGAAKSRYEQIISRINMSELTFIQKKYGKILKERPSCNHPDQELLNPFPLPLIIIGAKYDLFSNHSVDQQKLVCKTLRFLNHYYCSSLYFTSNKDEISMKKLKSILGNLAFGSSSTRTIQIEIDKPLSIPEGSDSFSSIGAPPPNADLTMSRLTVKSPLDMWKAVFCSTFPQVSTQFTEESTSIGSLKSEPRDPAKDPQYAEPLIDEVYKTKSEELERQQRQNERRTRELLQQAMADGLLVT